MSYHHIRTTYHTAKKDHDCDACVCVREYLDDLKGALTFAEYRAIAEAKHNDWKIKAGERYRNDVGNYCGNFQVLKSIPAIYEIVIDHELCQE